LVARRLVGRSWLLVGDLASAAPVEEVVVGLRGRIVLLVARGFEKAAVGGADLGGRLGPGVDGHENAAEADRVGSLMPED
jgi:hypothetical protein